LTAPTTDQQFHQRRQVLRTQRGHDTVRILTFGTGEFLDLGIVHRQKCLTGDRVHQNRNRHVAVGSRTRRHPVLRIGGIGQCPVRVRGVEPVRHNGLPSDPIEPASSIDEDLLVTLQETMHDGIVDVSQLEHMTPAEHAIDQRLLEHGKVA